MDPVSALGVAAATLQFLDASIKAYSAFQEIRSSAESSTERNKQLEDNIRAAQNLKGSLISASAPQGTADPVTELTARCASKADKLLNLLEYVRGSGKDIGFIRATFRAVNKGKQIEKLHSSLAEDRVTLDQMISQKLLSSIDILTVAQSKEFANLSSFVQKLIGDLMEQRKAQEADSATLAGKLDSVHYNMQLRFSEADRMMMREKVLGSLFFPEIDQRRSEIREPAPNTLDWLFGPTSKASSTSSVESEGYAESDSDSEQGSGNDSAWESDTESSDEGRSQPLWSNFRQWLREDTSMYWISGKAGSGKSTLMAHIVDDERTNHDLDVWREGNELRVLSFFFWRAGTQLQNSVLGLLRSLLYQLCRLQPFIADNILARLSSPIGIIPTWTERSLLEHITKAIQSSTGFRFCIFIDGLDEYTGPYHDLIDYINLLQKFGNLKVCASSRPELELVNKLRGLKQLRLQDLNQGDIKNFVHGSLAKTQLNLQERTDLAKQVVQRAEGVFLWASLVTQSLVKGSMAGDSKDITQKRLDSLPGDMEQLFKRMLIDVDVVYRESLALYVQLKMVEHEFNLGNSFTVSMIATLQLHERINSYEEFANECENTELRITTRSAGLLEVDDLDWAHEFFRNNKPEWERVTTKFINNKPRFTLVTDGLDRRRCAESEPYPAMLKYETRSMRWIHRSAFEFFSNLSEKIPSFGSGLSREALLQKISESYISYLLAAPSYIVDNIRSLMKARLAECLAFISMWYDNYPKMASAFLDNLLSFCIQFEMEELPVTITGESFHLDPDDFTTETAFWLECASTGNWSYISSRIGYISKLTDGSSLIAHLLAMSISKLKMVRIKDMSNLAQVIDSLAETLLHLTTQRLGTGGAVQTTAYKCIISAPYSYKSLYGLFSVQRCFVGASWREGVLDESMLIMTRIIFMISLPDCGIFEKLPESLSTLMEITELYVAPGIGFKRMSIQISGKAWTGYCYSVFPTQKKVENWEGCIASRVLAVQVPGAVKILCVPSFKKRQMAFHREPTFNYPPKESWKPTKELQDSQFISFHPSPATSCQLLSLFKYLSRTRMEFHKTPNAHEQREEVCGLLLREIKLAEQGLDGGQQLIAAACVRTALLDPDI